MRKSKFTHIQIMDAIKRVEVGFGILANCRKMGISAAIQKKACRMGNAKLEYRQSANSQQIAYFEKFNITVRYKWLSQHYWSNLEKVQEFATSEDVVIKMTIPIWLWVDLHRMS